MAVSTPQRQNHVVRRTVNEIGMQNQYQQQRVSRATVAVGDYGSYAPAYPRVAPTKKPATTVVAAPSGQVVADKQKLLKRFLLVGGVFLLCCLMIYRYAMILEANDHIEQLTKDCAAIEAKNQALQTKLDQGMELGALETYAKEELGMIRPDSSQVFYIDVTMENTMSGAEDGEQRVLQGAPGALVHAFRVLK